MGTTEKCCCLYVALCDCSVDRGDCCTGLADWLVQYDDLVSSLSSASRQTLDSQGRGLVFEKQSFSITLQDVSQPGSPPQRYCVTVDELGGVGPATHTVGQITNEETEYNGENCSECNGYFGVDSCEGGLVASFDTACPDCYTGPTSGIIKVGEECYVLGTSASVDSAPSCGTLAGDPYDTCEECADGPSGPTPPTPPPGTYWLKFTECSSGSVLYGSNQNTPSAPIVRIGDDCYSWETISSLFFTPGPVGWGAEYPSCADCDTGGGGGPPTPPDPADKFIRLTACEGGATIDARVANLPTAAVVRYAEDCYTWVEISEPASYTSLSLGSEFASCNECYTSPQFPPQPTDPDPPADPTCSDSCRVGGLAPCCFAPESQVSVAKPTIRKEGGGSDLENAVIDMCNDFSANNMPQIINETITECGTFGLGGDPVFIDGGYYRAYMLAALTVVSGVSQWDWDLSYQIWNPASEDWVDLGVVMRSGFVESESCLDASWFNGAMVDPFADGVGAAIGASTLTVSNNPCCVQCGGTCGEQEEDVCRVAGVCCDEPCKCGGCCFSACSDAKVTVPGLSYGGSDAQWEEFFTFFDAFVSSSVIALHTSSGFFACGTFTWVATYNSSVTSFYQPNDLYRIRIQAVRDCDAETWSVQIWQDIYNVSEEEWQATTGSPIVQGYNFETDDCCGASGDQTLIGYVNDLSLSGGFTIAIRNNTSCQCDGQCYSGGANCDGECVTSPNCADYASVVYEIENGLAAECDDAPLWRVEDYDPIGPQYNGYRVEEQFGSQFIYGTNSECNWDLRLGPGASLPWRFPDNDDPCPDFIPQVGNGDIHITIRFVNCVWRARAWNVNETLYYAYKGSGESPEGFYYGEGLRGPVGTQREYKFGIRVFEAAP